MLVFTKFCKCRGEVRGKRAFLKESCAKNFILRLTVCLADMVGKGILEYSGS